MAQATLANAEPHYPVEDQMAESWLHLLVRSLLLMLTRRLLHTRGEIAFVGSDQFLYWVRGDPQRAIAPDLYVLPGVDPDSAGRSWKLWEEGVVPSLAVEVVSDDVEKDYIYAPMRYAEIGVAELVVYDPEPHRGSDRIRWQVYRRRGDALLLEEQGDGDRVRSEALGCWLRVVPDEAGRPLVRIALDPTGEDLLPTTEEAERAEKEAERAEKDAERARRIALEQVVAELRRKLDQRA